MSPVVVALRERTLAESLALRVHAGWKPRPGWINRAACAGLKNADHIPELCPGCPVRLDCLADTMRAEQQHPADYIVGHAALSAADRRRWRLPWEQPINHGIMSGHTAHRRRNETPCAACKTARQQYERSRKAERKTTAA